MIDNAELPTIPGRIPLPAAGRRSETDVIIIGTGAAGLSAAVRLSDAGRRVTLITKGEPGDGSTAWAQGGLAAVLDPADSLQVHIDDTLTAGAGLCEPDAVAALVMEAPAAIERLAGLGARFDRDDRGEYALGLEGGHHARRIIHAGGDASGAEVARTLAARVSPAPASSDSVAAEDRESGNAGAIDSGTGPSGTGNAGSITLLSHTTVVDLLLTGGAVTGVRVLGADQQVGEITAAAVVLAAGGIGQAWETTTNPATATGDGIALALRAGAVLQDIEFVQFHPTVLVVPPDHRRPGDRGVLISEAVRGEGARLIDRHGRLIMAGRHPLADLAPRDVVAATMHADLLASGDDHLFLDGTGLGEQVWRTHFPSILQLCRERGVDPVTEPIPVRPAEHYSCGGVQATLDGVTSVPGLYAVGEVASTGVQGANRLASNSLTEALIAGDRVGRLLCSRPGLDDHDRSDHDHDRPAVALDPLPTASEEFAVAASARDTVVTAVSRGAGVLRDESGLSVLLKTLSDLEPSDGPVDVADVEATNLYTVGTAVALAALARPESRGCHRRADHTVPDPGWRRHSLTRLGPDGLQVSHTHQEIL